MKQLSFDSCLNLFWTKELCKHSFEPSLWLGSLLFQGHSNSRCTCRSCMAGGKAGLGCVCLASPTGIARPHSSLMHDAGITHITVHLNDWNLSIEDGNCYTHGKFVIALHFVCHHCYYFQYNLTQEVGRWSTKGNLEGSWVFFRELDLYNLSCPEEEQMRRFFGSCLTAESKLNSKSLCHYDFCLANFKPNWLDTEFLNSAWKLMLQVLTVAIQTGAKQKATRCLWNLILSKALFMY